MADMLNPSFPGASTTQTVQVHAAASADVRARAAPAYPAYSSATNSHSTGTGSYPSPRSPTNQLLQRFDHTANAAATSYGQLTHPHPHDRHDHTHSHARKPSTSTAASDSSTSLSLDRAEGMASSLSLNQQASSGYGGGGGGGGGSSSSGGDGGARGGDDKSALSSLNLGFLKGLTDKRTNRDGQPPKRRGPKPDSKPALTRRQELNRQAQRTHRERKELYIKALEDEVLRLKEIYSTLSQDKEKLAEENRQLKTLLAQNAMMPGSNLPSGHPPPGGGASGTGSSSYPMSGALLGGGGSGSGGGAGSGSMPTSASGGGMLDDSISNPASVGGYTSSGSVAGSYAAPSSHTSAFTPPPLSAGGHSHHHHHHQQQPHSSAMGGGGSAGRQEQMPANRNPNLDYDQAGIDFVLTLEKPCMDHMPWLLERSTEVGGNEPCGHALMASCPPEPFPDLTPDIPFGYTNTPSTTFLSPPNHTGAGLCIDESGQRTWELSKADLATLLDLSKRLNLDGEITPVMAWGMVLGHPRLAELGRGDFERLTEELIGKVRCYGFGAVMEEFEVRDALENVLSTKPDPQVGMVY